MHKITILNDILKTLKYYNAIGIYIHIPFCVDRCIYCSFTTTNDLSLKSKIIDKICLNILKWGMQLNNPNVDTLYIGGGTPSILNISELHKITLSITQAFSTNILTEATIEANPHSIDFQWLLQAKALGWNRISFGIQTLNDQILHQLGRLHDTKTAINAIHMAHKAGFTKINCDLIIGLPNQNTKSIKRDIDILRKNGIKHFSIYVLDVNKSHILKSKINSGKLILPEDSIIDTMYKNLQIELSKSQIHHYEISNYAKESNTSKHNIRYWQRRPYLGIGPNSASHFDPWRWHESNDIKTWLNNNKINFNKLSTTESLAEIPLLGLRMNNGINWNQIKYKGQILNLKHRVNNWEVQLQQFVNNKMIIKDNNILRFTKQGIMLSNAILQIFI